MAYLSHSWADSNRLGVVQTAHLTYEMVDLIAYHGMQWLNRYAGEKGARYIENNFVCNVASRVLRGLTSI